MTLAASLKRMFTRRGEAITVSRPGGTYDPTTAMVTGSGGAVTFNTVGVKRSFQHNQVDGVVIQRTDEQVKFPALDATFDPRAGDTVSVGSQLWTVMNVKRASRDGTIVSYDLHIRAAHG